jgi:hypothetical protein
VAFEVPQGRAGFLAGVDGGGRGVEMEQGEHDPDGGEGVALDGAGGSCVGLCIEAG